MAPKRVVILISGRGSNMAALIDAAQEPGSPVEIVGVISNRADAKGLDIAAAKGIATATVLSKGLSHGVHDAAIGAELSQMRADIVCLAGYLRLLNEDFVEKWQGRMINIHPALLPSFKGLDTHARALEAGLRIHGCTVHFVTAAMDDGPIIAQAAVPVLLDDTADSLGARVLAAEHRLYPMALGLVAEGKVRLVGNRAVFHDVEDATQRDAQIVSPLAASREPELESLARFTP